jgi:hypothetical protein
MWLSTLSCASMTPQMPPFCAASQTRGRQATTGGSARASWRSAGQERRRRHARMLPPRQRHEHTLPPRGGTAEAELLR